MGLSKEFPSAGFGNEPFGDPPKETLPCKPTRNRWGKGFDSMSFPVIDHGFVGCLKGTWKGADIGWSTPHLKPLKNIHVDDPHLPVAQVMFKPPKALDRNHAIRLPQLSPPPPLKTGRFLPREASGALPLWQFQRSCQVCLRVSFLWVSRHMYMCRKERRKHTFPPFLFGGVPAKDGASLSN